MMDFGLPDEPPVTRYQLLPHHSATHDSALDSGPSSRILATINMPPTSLSFFTKPSTEAVGF